LHYHEKQFDRITQNYVFIKADKYFPNNDKLDVFQTKKRLGFGSKEEDKKKKKTKKP
jgi:hypothetical protein